MPSTLAPCHCRSLHQLLNNTSEIGETGAMPRQYLLYDRHQPPSSKLVMIMAVGLPLIINSSILSVEAFLVGGTTSLQCRQSCRDFTSLFSENDPSEDGVEESPLDAMRRMLEDSWDAEKMGRVPLDSASGALECVQAIMEAAMKQEGETGVFFVDLHLPAYDISQGERLYDVVLATEFCIELSNGLEGKSEILVRDQKTLDTVQRILTVREDSAAALMEDEDDDDDDDIEEDDDEPANDLPTDTDDDDGDEDVSLEEDVDAFRKKLLAGWEVTDGVPMSKDSRTDVPIPPESKPMPERNAKVPRNNKTYRLASLFGSARIGSGGDMPRDVVRAVRDNALTLEDEQNIVILNSAGQDEMVGVRALVEKYSVDKKIILVNCQFTQMPRELQSAETVYSILPLVATEKNTGKDLNVRDKGSQSKVVVLRRYPKDWEIFVDLGNGFELVETVRVTAATRRGVPMERITESLERYLKSI